MAASANPMTCDFTGKPETRAFAEEIASYVASLPGVRREEKAQLSFAVRRKFLWLWSYEQTADGTLYLNVTLDRRLDDPHVHNITQVSAHRWNHHVVVRSSAAASSDWLRALVREGHAFASR